MTDAVTRLNAALDGRYRVERELGEGGMAIVYLAADLRHERKVAIKVLRPELAEAVGADRFLAEIKTTANLQHPHVLPLFDSGEADGFLFYVMPYVEGETLRERIDQERQLSIEDAVRIATDVGEALDHAHRQDVIHRDIKPENILLSDGRALVADFGIALALGTEARGRLTEAGVSLGTPAYMSPEQITGDLPVGPQADVYALGCVLYEMLAGRPPHTASTSQAQIGRILVGNVSPVSEERRSVPPHVDAAILKALSSLPADRFSTTRRFIEAIEMNRVSTEVSATAARRRPIVVGSLAASFVAVAALIVATMIGDSGTPPAVESESRQVTFAGDVLNATLSPDGEVVAYVTGKEGSAQTLWLQELSGGAARSIYSSGLIQNPQWSPDNAYLAFVADSVGTNLALRTYVLSRLGSSDPDAIPSDHVYAAWSSDASKLVGWSAKRNDLSIVDLRTRSSLESVSLDLPLDWLLGVSWSPVRDQLALAIVSEGQDGLWTLPLGSDTPTLVVQDSLRIRNPVWSGDGGSVYYARSSDETTTEIWRVGVRDDGSRGSRPERVYGPFPMAVRFGIQPPYSLSSDETRLLYVNQLSISNLVMVQVERSGAVGPVRELTTGTASRVTPRLSPDGQRASFVQASGRGSDLSIIDFEDGSVDQITYLDGNVWSPEWSADGTRIAFGSNHEGVSTIRVADLGDGSTRALGATEYEHANHIAWGSLPGVAHQMPGDQRIEIVDAETEPQVLRDDQGGVIYDPRPSPSGRWLATVLARRGGGGGSLWLWSPDGTVRTKLGDDYIPIGWREDESAVYALRGLRAFALQDVYEVPTSGGEPRLYASLPFAVKPWDVTISTDGRTIIASIEEVRTDAWIVEALGSGR